MKKKLLLSAVLSVGAWGIMVSNASALTIHQVDDKIYFPDYVSTSTSDSFAEWKDYNVDSIGEEPEVNSMTIEVDDQTMLLKSVSMDIGDRIFHDTLLINTSVDADFHSWEYMVRDVRYDKHSEPSTIAAGLYEVGQEYAYTYANDETWRNGHVNGIDQGLTMMDSSFAPSYVGTTLFYDFSQYSILWDKGNSVVAYTQYCANDIIYNNEVPEPATILLFGSGLAGLAGAARRRRAVKK